MEGLENVSILHRQMIRTERKHCTTFQNTEERYVIDVHAENIWRYE